MPGSGLGGLASYLRAKGASVDRIRKRAEEAGLGTWTATSLPMAHSRPPGVRHATTPDGLELPVVDVTHPAFALPVDRADALAAIEEYVRTEAARGALRQWLRRAMMR